MRRRAEHVLELARGASASSIPSGASVIRSATSCARSSSRSPGKAASSATSQSAAIETASRTSARDATGAPVAVEREPASVRPSAASKAQT